MTYWENNHIKFTAAYIGVEQEIVAALDREGLSGWECVSVIYPHNYENVVVHLYLKRKLSEDGASEKIGMAGLA